jgi:hypothetical protein
MIMDDLWRIYLVGGIPTPLKNDGVRQLRLLFPMYENFKNNSFMFKTTNQLDTNPGIEWKLMEIIADRV